MVTSNLETAAVAGDNAQEGVIIIAATDDDGQAVTSFEHLKLGTPDVMRLRYRIYAVNSKSGKLVMTADREISASVTNTADGRTTGDATAQGDELKQAGRADEPPGSCESRRWRWNQLGMPRGAAVLDRAGQPPFH